MAEGAAIALNTCMERHTQPKLGYAFQMSTPDFNLLVTLDVLLAEGSVARAAKRLRLSPSAMSRALARLRETTGDPLLVRAGRGLVPTPRALELRDLVSRLVHDGRAVLRPTVQPDFTKLVRTFTLRTSEGFVENFGANLISRVGDQAPGVRLRFVQKPDKDSAPLRQGIIDFETGVIEKTTAPEFRAQSLFRDRFIGVVRAEHPLAQGKVTLARYVNGRHICVARHGLAGTPLGDVERGIDGALKALGRERQIIVIVGGFSAAVGLARSTELIASVPERHTGNLRNGMHTFALPFATQQITISLLWHPRQEGDPAHRWMRGCIREACGSN
jgi:DNA-binding transcriptional LysR family regulator